MVESDEFGTTVVGTCTSMCPENEIHLRERENLLHPFEVLLVLKDGRRKADPRKMVKEYRRPAAGREDMQPCDLRPPDVLKSTVNYLLQCIIEKQGCPFCDVYDFVFDRLRAVRQDLVTQNVYGMDAIEILEKITRFHIYSGYRLCDQPIKVFSAKINDQHTQECIKRLLSLYERVEGPHLHQEEFESLYLLFNLGQTEALMHYFDLPQNIRNQPLLKTAYYISEAHLLGNFVQVLRLSHCELMKKNPVCLCAFHRHLAAIQSKSLHIMSWGYSSKMSSYPVSVLERLLYMNDTDQVIHICKQHGLNVKEDTAVNFVKTSYKSPEKVEMVHSKFIDSCLVNSDLMDIFFKRTFEDKFNDLVISS